MKRVLICGFTSDCGGMESYIMSIYRNCDRTKIQFDFLNTNVKKIAFSDEIEELGGKIYYVPKKKDNFIQHYIQLNRLFKEHHFVGIYFQCNQKLESLDVFKYAKKYNVKHRAIHSHNSTQRDVSFIHRIRIENVERKIDKYVNKYFACSKDAGRWMFGDRQYEVLPNSVDTNKFKYDETIRENIREKFGCQNKLVLGTVGRLAEQKNPLFLVDLVASVSKDKDIIFMHIGDGVLRKDMEEKIDEKNLSSVYKLLGEQKNVQEYLNAFDLFLLPSNYEGFPIVLVEAQAMGLNCIVSDNITRDCNLVDLLQYLPLDIDIWKETILNTKIDARGNSSSLIANKGYDINNLKNIVCDYFLN